MNLVSITVDHAYAEEHGFVELYLADRLSEGERTAFEAHYFDCAACLEQLEAASEFGAGMRQVAAEDTAKSRVGLLAALALLSSRHRLALGGLLLLLVALPCGWLVARALGRERWLAAAPTAQTAAARLASLATQVQALRQSAAGDRQRFTQDLARERQARAAAERDALRPQVNLPIAVLAAVRGGEEAGRAPVNRLTLSPATESIVLAMELASVDYPSYHAALRTAAGLEVWKADGLRPDSRDSLAVLLPTRMLPPGVYRLTLEGVREGGRRFAVAVYPFQVAQP